jgi:tripartite-type tricarboxylate transporter receptor subunit TctC
MPSLTRRALLATTLAAPALAQGSYPSAPLRVVVGYAPGGTGDVMIRMVADRIRPLLGQPMVIENRSGAAGAIGAQAVIRAAPDGHTLFMGHTPEMAIARSFLATQPFDAERDLAPVVLVGVATLALVVHADSPWHSVQDLMAAARARPGTISFASPGNGSPAHFAGEVLALRAGAPMVHVPYRGGGPALVDVLAGQVGFFFSGLPSAIQHVRSGRLRLLAVSTARRSPGVPETPTVQEAGVPEFDFSLWGGLFAPAATPPDLIDRVNREVNAVLADPQLRERFSQEGADILPNTPGEFAAFVRQEAVRYAAVIAATGVKPE